MNSFAKNWKSMLLYLIIPVVFIGAIVYSSSRNKQEELPYSEILGYFQEEKVESFELDLSSGKLIYTLKGEEKQNRYTVPNVSIFVDNIDELINAYNTAHPDTPVKYNYVKGVNSSMWASMIPSILMFGLLIVGAVFLFRNMNKAMDGEANRTLSFGKAKAKVLVDDEKRKTTFADVAGADEEKAELAEIVEFLKEPQRFNDLGARIPKGVLLVGPPGTGKTLLARAVAGEAGVPFLSISGSDFVEMYVGVGASRVRNLFEQAKKSSPAIIFIDEIDAVGRHRGAGMGGGHDEREQTLNQLLVEMDGFGANEGVIIIAATNRPDILDPALLRPGRFDRQVTVGYPDTKGREEILKVHAKGKSIAPDVKLGDIAKATIGFTGADLENLLNEAALLAARRRLKAITKPEIEEATIKVVMGTEKRSHKVSDKEKHLTAFHEGGHAVATYFLESQDPVHQVSIIPRGRAGGYTMSLPIEDRSYKSKNEMLDELVVLLGGRVAEALVLDDISTGASNDIQRATKIARDMVTKYGMSSNLGPLSYGSDNEEVFIGRDYGHVRDYSETTAAQIDNEVKAIINDAYLRTENLLKAHMEQLELIAAALIQYEKVDGDAFKQLMETGVILEKEEPIQPKVAEPAGTAAGGESEMGEVTDAILAQSDAKPKDAADAAEPEENVNKEG